MKLQTKYCHIQTKGLQLMKNKRVFYIFLYMMLFIESLVILFGFIYYRNINYKKIAKDSYEIKFQNGAFVILEMDNKGFKTVSFEDEKNNHCFIALEKTMGGYFCIYNANLDFAIDNRLSDKKDFLFQRLERYKDDSSFYYIDYGNGISTEELPLPAIEGQEFD